MIIDLANYSDVPTADQVAGLRALGVVRAVVGSSYSTKSGNYVAPAQLAALETGGVLCGEYQFPDALRGTAREWWLDCETAQATQASVRSVCAGAHPPTGIYSRKSWWDENVGSWNIKAEFPWLRLWDAAYVHGEGRGVRCEIAAAEAEHVAQAIANERSRIRPFARYAGFEWRDLVQWHGSVKLCGLNVDLSEEEDDEMWVRMNAVAPFFHDRTLRAGPDGTMELATDFPKLPVCKAVDLDVYLAPDSTGGLVFKDGSGAFAGKVTPRSPHQVIRVVPDRQRQVRFAVEGPSAHVELLGIVGYLA